MEKITLELPQLNLVTRNGYGGKYLERFAEESGKTKANLTFQEDSKEDPRIITIKYEVPEKENSIMYYSEAANKHAIVTFNLGYNYQGRVLAMNRHNHKLGFSLEHLSKEGLRKKHIERINQIEDLRKDLTTEYVAKRYKDLIFHLNS